MQITPRYLLKNRTVVVANDTGFVVEYRPVYSRQIQVYKGIDNVLEFKVLNADQKGVSLAGKTPKFIAFDEEKNLIVEHDGVPIIGDDSAATRGLFQVTITENDLLNIKQQYMSYNIFIVDANNNKTITYTDSHFGGNGIIYVSAEQFPGPSVTFSVSTFTETSGESGVIDSVWNSESVDAQPAINGNEALHTAAVYTDTYIGTVKVQVTLDNQVTGTTKWADVATLSFTGTETAPTPVNFNGVFSHIRFQASANPSNKITKILVRN